MKKFRFRLDPVLRVRRIEEERAKIRLMEANAVARHTASVVESRLHAYLTAPRPDAVMTLEEFDRARFLLEAAATSVESARVAHRDALDVVDQCRVDWLERKQQVGAVERLEERKRDEHMIDIRRAEDRLIDDLVVARHRIRNQGVAR